MRRFRYRLERILEIRRYHERERELELSAATARCVRLKNKMAASEAGMSEQLRFRAPGTGVVDLAGLQTSELYRARLAEEYKAATWELVVRDKERQEAQARYLEASRDRKVLQRLRERREHEYYKRQRLEEFKDMDDLSQASRGEGQ